jgi:hypothetical protein
VSSFSGEPYKLVFVGRGFSRVRSRVRPEAWTKFDPTDKWIETRTEAENVINDARKINQVLVRGKYGTQAERYWSVLRANINYLARFYNLTPRVHDPKRKRRVWENIRLANSSSNYSYCTDGSSKAGNCASRRSVQTRLQTRYR